jgi:hypothetical protein
MKVLLTMALLAATPAAAIECPAERAEYVHASDGDITAGFITSRHFASMGSDLYFRVTTKQRTCWFTLQVSNGYGGTSLSAVGDPYVAADGDENNGPVVLGVSKDFPNTMGFHSLDERLAITELPRKGEPAPPYIYTPDLGLVMWYAPRAITEDPTALRDPMGRGAFRLTRCLDRAAPPALP